MSELKNAKREAFARLIAAGKDSHESFVVAGFSAKNQRTLHAAVSRLLRDQQVATRIEELRSERQRMDAAVRQDIVTEELTKDWVKTRLMQVAERCMQAEPVLRKEGKEWVETGEYKFDSAGANRALELLGKEQGMFIERKEQGKPGDFERSKEELQQEVDRYKQADRALEKAAKLATSALEKAASKAAK